MARITLLTDFGTVDGYVGAMKGVLATRAPLASVEDISHEISPGDVRKASRVLGRYWDRYPPGTVHLVVVDPGVGTERRALAMDADGRFFVAPDNGVLSVVLDRASTWECVAARVSSVVTLPPSKTFHGRDLFAPMAVHLALGTPLEALGSRIEDPRRLGRALPREVPGWMQGEVVEVDRFGNLATNLPESLVREAGEVEVSGHRIAFHETYGEVASGELLALRDSEGRVEIAVRDGSAAAGLGSGVGSEVRVRTR
jgi:S-adenosylmethionine hydrolase